MQPIDIESIIKKYSSSVGYSALNSLSLNRRVQNSNGNIVGKGYSFMGDEKSYTQNDLYKQGEFKTKVFSTERNTNNNQPIGQQPYWQKFSTYSNLNTNNNKTYFPQQINISYSPQQINNTYTPQQINNNYTPQQINNNYSTKQINNQSRNNEHDEIPKQFMKYDSINKYNTSNKQLNDKKSNQNNDKIVNNQQPFWRGNNNNQTSYQYQYQPLDNKHTQITKHYQMNSINYTLKYDTIANQKYNNFASTFQQQRPISTNQHIKKQQTIQQLKNTQPQNNLMSLFNQPNNNTYTNLFNQPKQYITQQHQTKPQISINSTNNILNTNQRNLYNSNTFNLSNSTTFKNPTQFTTKPVSNWRLTSQHSTYNNLSYQNQDLSQKNTHKSTINNNQPIKNNNNQPIKNNNQSHKQYKKVQSTTTNYTPNNQGFIPLHKTKQQIDNDIYDLNEYQFKDKKVYDQLQIKDNIKTSKLTQFNSNSFCGWKNNVIYDINTKDDHKNKSLLGKWC